MNTVDKNIHLVIIQCQNRGFLFNSLKSALEQYNDFFHLNILRMDQSVGQVHT